MRALIVILVCACCCVARASDTLIGSTILKTSTRNIQMQCWAMQPGGVGYCVVRLDFTPTAAVFARDLQLQLIVSPGGRRSELDFDFYHDVEIVKGEKSARAELYIPCYTNWEILHVRVSSNNDKISPDELSFPLVVSNGNRNTEFRVGIVSPQDAAAQDAAWKTCPDIRTLVTLLGMGPLPNDAQVDRLPHRESMDLLSVATIGTRLSCSLLDETNLRSEWLAYSPLDVIIVAAPVLVRTQQQHPESFEALLDWVSTGASLWIYATRDTPAPLLRSLQTKPRHPHASSLKLLADNLRLDEVNDWSDINITPQSSVNILSINRHQALDALIKAKHPFADELTASEMKDQVAIYEFGQGRVVMLADADPFPGSYAFWEAIVSGSNLSERTHNKRVGVNTEVGSYDYWGWLIPSVGQAPVKTFLFLNALFTIVAGPVCYFLLRRRARLPLFYFFVPAFSVFATSSMFLWAILADGFDTKVRALQISWIDKAHDRTLTQARQTYFSALGNSKSGLVFPIDAAVYPVLGDDPYQRFLYEKSRSDLRSLSLVSTETTQSFHGRFLPARTQYQYLISYPQKGAAGPSFAVDGKKVMVTHHGLAPLSDVFYKGSDQWVYHVTNLAPGESKQMQPTIYGVWHSRLMEKLDGEAFGDTDSELRLPPRSRVNQYFSFDNTDGSILENRISEWTSLMPNRAYIAFTDIDTSLIGVPEAVVDDSAHILMGVTP